MQDHFQRIMTQSMETFANVDKAIHWLCRPNRMLENRIPFTFLDTEEGARAVEVLLGQIAHGLFS